MRGSKFRYIEVGIDSQLGYAAVSGSNSYLLIADYV